MATVRDAIETIESMQFYLTQEWTRVIETRLSALKQFQDDEISEESMIEIRRQCHIAINAFFDVTNDMDRAVLNISRMISYRNIDTDK
ncbi:MAG: hypothetical protein IKF90_25140 [Parasporobacterium sp.]|nr:hypothetical protein [Parasporobacterium sp.]